MKEVKENRVLGAQGIKLDVNDQPNVCCEPFLRQVLPGYYQALGML